MGKKKHYTGKIVLKREEKPVNILQKNIETINRLKPYVKQKDIRRKKQHETD